MGCFHVLLVGASYENGAKYSNSNYGDNTVDLFAPRASKTVEITDGSYPTVGETSATPLVTGAAALLKAYRSSLTPSHRNQRPIADRFRPHKKDPAPMVDAGSSIIYINRGRIQPAVSNPSSFTYFARHRSNHAPLILTMLY